MDMPKWGKVRIQGEDTGRAKLTNEQVCVILLRYKYAGETISTLSKEYGVCGIDGIVKGKTWKNIDRVELYEHFEQFTETRVCQPDETIAYTIVLGVANYIGKLSTRPKPEPKKSLAQQIRERDLQRKTSKTS